LQAICAVQFTQCIAEPHQYEFFSKSCMDPEIVVLGRYGMEVRGAVFHRQTSKKTDNGIILGTRFCPMLVGSRSHQPVVTTAATTIT